MKKHKMLTMLSSFFLSALLFSACGGAVSGEEASSLSSPVSEVSAENEFILPDLSEAGCVTVTACPFIFYRGDTIQVRDADILAQLTKTLSATGFEEYKEEISVPDDHDQSFYAVDFYLPEHPAADAGPFLTLWVDQPEFYSACAYIKTDRVYCASEGAEELKSAIEALVTHYCGVSLDDFSLPESSSTLPFGPDDVTLPIEHYASMAELEEAFGECSVPDDTTGLYALEFDRAEVGICGAVDDKLFISSLWSDSPDFAPKIRGVSIGDSIQEVLARFPVETDENDISSMPENGSLVLYGDLNTLGPPMAHLYFQNGRAVFASYSVGVELVRFYFNANGSVYAILWAILV